MITLIVAHDSHRVIGNEGRLPWHLPEDLKHFKETTLNHTILMGRKTFESIGRPLPQRKNIVVTRDPNFHCPQDVSIVHDLISFLKQWPNDQTLFVIGGASIYAEALPYADELIISLVSGIHPGDSYFPPYHEQFHLFAEQPMNGFIIQVFRR